MLANLCPPALIYLVFSTTQIVIDTIKGFHNTAFLKIWVTFAFTVLLNFLCEKGLGIVSWIIVFIPFILMTLIISILLIMFGLDPATGKSKSYKGRKGRKGKKPKKGDKNISGATLKPGYDKRREAGKGWAIKGAMDKGWVVKPMTFGKDNIQKAYDEDESDKEDEEDEEDEESEEDEDKEQVKEGPDNRKRGTDEEWDKRNLKGGVPAHSHKIGHTLDGASYPSGKRWGGYKQSDKPSADAQKKARDEFRKDQQKRAMDEASSKAGAVSGRCKKYCSMSCVGSCRRWGCPICKGKGIAPAKAESGKKTHSSCPEFCGKGKTCTAQCKKWGCPNCCPDPPSNLKTICKTANKKCNKACTRQSAEMCLVNQNYLNPRKCCIRWAPCMIINRVNKEGFGGLVPEGFKHGRVI